MTTLKPGTARLDRRNFTGRGPATRWRRLGRVSGAALLFTLGACADRGEGGASSATGGHAGEGSEACTPGATRPCVGFDACSGDQLCSADGTTWSACDCGSATAGAAGSGAAPGNVAGASAGGTGGRDASGGAAGSAAAPEGWVRCTVDGSALALPATFRDFTADHPDFERYGTLEATRGLVDSTIEPGGVPVLAIETTSITSAETFAEWYADVPGTNATIPGTLLLHDDGSGSYVNRWGSAGEPWQHQNLTSCGVAGGGCGACEPLPDGWTCSDPCPDPLLGACSVNLVTFDGTPVFFPIDGAANAITPESEYSTATIPVAFGGSREPESGGALHNFHFTTEIRFLFTYESARSPAIDIGGDDDIWVFVNGRLAIDLGGIHEAQRAGITLIGMDATSLGLAEGRSYEVAIFHAERQISSSSFQLRLTGFDWTTSWCPEP